MTLENIETDFTDLSNRVVRTGGLIYCLHCKIPDLKVNKNYIIKVLLKYGNKESEI